MSGGDANFCAALMAQREGRIFDACGVFDLPEVCSWAEAATDDLRKARLLREEPVLVPITGTAADVAGILAVISAGGVAVPIHARVHAETFAQIREQTKARFSLGFTTAGLATTRPRVTVYACEAPPERSLLRGAGMITFTSGSTGRPKGVVLSLSRMTAKLRTLQQRLQMPEGAISAVPLQLIFSFGQWATFLTLLRGGTVLMTDRFDADAMAVALSEGRCDYLAAVPTMLRMLLGKPVSSSRFSVLTGGEAVNADLRRTFFSTWTASEIYSIYGLTESGTCDLFHHDAPNLKAADSLGFAAPNVELQVDPSNSELLIKTPYAMLGYLDMPSETAATFQDGWLRTGDMAEMLPSGEVRYSGRLKEIINRAGNKVSPLEVEALFAQHPAVREVLATGVQDPRLGEAIHLLVVPRADMGLQADALLEWAQNRTERFKLPDRIHLGDALPVGPTGKANRKELRARIEQGAMA